MPLNSIKTQLHHYLRDLAIYQAWRTLGITFIFLKWWGFFFPCWLYLDDCIWSKGQSFLPHKIYSHVFYSCTFYSTGEGNWGWFLFPCTITFFFFFPVFGLWCFSVTLLLHSLWKKFLCEVSVSCLHFEKWAPKCGITEISIVITVAQKTQHD